MSWFYARKRHHVNPTRTVRATVRLRRKTVVSDCGMGFKVKDDDRYTVRWDATSCNICRRIVKLPVVDFSVIQERSFDPIPDATYNARLSAWELKKGGKGPYYNLEFTFLGDESLGNRKIWAMSSISDGALWRFKRDMIALGANPDDLQPGSQVDTDDIVEGCVGAECRLVTEQEDYPKKDGTTGRRSVVKEILSALPF